MDPTLSCGLLYMSFGLLIWLASMDLEAFFTKKRRGKKGEKRLCTAWLVKYPKAVGPLLLMTCGMKG